MLDLLQFMQHDGYLSANELTALRKTSKELGENPVRLLRSLNIASPEQIQFFLHKHFKIHMLNEEAMKKLNTEYQVFVPIDIAIFYSCFGIGEENGIAYIAMEDPSDRGIINQLRFLLDKRVVGVCATVYQLAEGLTKIYQLPISNLKLTTAIERSRGVIGGVRYEENHEKVIVVTEDFSGVGLEDENLPQVEFDAPKPIEPIVESIPAPPIPEVTAAPLAPPEFDFIDGSSGEVDPKYFTSNNKDETNNLDNKETAPEDVKSDDMNGLFENNFMSDNSNDKKPDLDYSKTEQGQSDDMQFNLEEHSKPQQSEPTFELEEQVKPPEITPPKVSEQVKQKFSSILNQALTKISMVKSKAQAVELINKLLVSLECELILDEDDNFRLKGVDFEVSSNWKNLESYENEMYVSLMPVLKKMSKLI